MKRRLIAVIFAAVMCVMCACCFVACTDEEEKPRELTSEELLLVYAYRDGYRSNVCWERDVNLGGYNRERFIFYPDGSVQLWRQRSSNNEYVLNYTAEFRFVREEQTSDYGIKYRYMIEHSDGTKESYDLYLSNVEELYDPLQIHDSAYCFKRIG